MWKSYFAGAFRTLETKPFDLSRLVERIPYERETDRGV